MKNLRIATAVLAIFMLFTFSSCLKEESFPNEATVWVDGSSYYYTENTFSDDDYEGAKLLYIILGLQSDEPVHISFFGFHGAGTYSGHQDFDASNLPVTYHTGDGVMYDAGNYIDDLMVIITDYDEGKNIKGSFQAIVEDDDTGDVKSISGEFSIGI